MVQNEHLDRVSQNAVKVHRFGRRRRVQHLHAGVEIVGVEADGYLIAIYAVAYGLGHGLAPEEVTVRSKPLLPFHRVFALRNNYEFGHVIISVASIGMQPRACGTSAARKRSVPDSSAAPLLNAGIGLQRVDNAAEFCEFGVVCSERLLLD